VIMWLDNALFAVIHRVPSASLHEFHSA
jgi:hypothetical protein